MLSKPQQLPTGIPDKPPSPQPAHVYAEHYRTHRLATTELIRYTPRHFHGRQTVGLTPRGATSFSSPIYELATPLFKAYANHLHATVDPTCPSCGDEQQIVEHWLQRCSNAEALRQQLFGKQFPPLCVLTTNPGSVLALVRKTFL